MIETQLYKVDQQLQQLVSLWEHRRAQLDTFRMVIEFKEAVPEVTVWLETRGVELLKNKNNFGRSREEVCVPVYCFCYIKNEVATYCGRFSTGYEVLTFYLASI